MAASSDRTDAHLLGEFARGDRDALGELAGRHERALLGLCRGLCHGQADRAGDIVQETWVRVIRAGGRFNGRSSVKTWLYRIALNEFRRAMRAKSFRMTRSERAATTTRGSSDANATDADCAGTEQNQRVRDALGGLTFDKRAVLLLCYHNDLTHEQAAEILGIPLGTLKSRLHHALREMRERLVPETET
jgi:RNA polymerase sigma-70 factor (ECF subfamily)